MDTKPDDAPDPYRAGGGTETWYLLTVTQPMRTFQATWNVVTQRRPEEWLLAALRQDRAQRASGAFSTMVGPVGPISPPALVMARPISREIADELKAVGLRGA